MSEVSIQLTGDGSATLFSNRFQETYHSKKGALTESLHIFIEEGFKKISDSKNSMRVGEIGLGSGLNAMLTLYESEKLGTPVFYQAIEAYPIEKEIVTLFSNEEWNTEKSLYEKLMTEQNGKLNEQFHFQITIGLWPIINPFSDLDVLYYDAFAPACQPELWDETALSEAWKSLKTGGILVTYCAKGEVKRTLKKIGFTIENPAGPPGKREMTRATKA